MDPNVASSSRVGSLRRWALVGCLAAVVLGAGVFLGRHCFGPADAAPDPVPEPASELPKSLFRDWGNAPPDVAFVLSGQTFAYLQPCGCSEPQYGGLVRRYNVMKMLEKKGWKLAGIDLGEIYPPKKAGGGFDHSDGVVVIPEQAMEKFKTTLRALDVMNYQDFGIGLSELKIPLMTGLTQMLALNTKKPRPLSLDLKDPNKIYEDLSVRSHDIITAGPAGNQIRVGVSNVVAPSVAAKVKGEPNIAFFGNAKMIRALLPILAKEKVDAVILLVHGDAQEVQDIAKLCNDERQKNPGLPKVDLILHTSEFDTPPKRPQPIPGVETRAIYPGHKGKDIGVLGIFRKPGGLDLKFELIELGPEFKTPDAQAKDHPIMKLIQDYAETVKTANFLDAYKPFRVEHATQRALAGQGIEAKYVGSERCADCHAAEYKVWQDAVWVDAHGHKIGHAVGYKSLERANHPSLRQYDPECVACHTTGFKYRTGYFDSPAGANEAKVAKHNQKLLNVGCESCHGPGSMHADNPNNAAYYPLINPIKGVDEPMTPNAKVLADRFCQSCHDIENDVNWGSRKPFEKSWAKIRHTGLKKAAGGQAP